VTRADRLTIRPAAKLEVVSDHAVVNVQQPYAALMYR
jgi:hypothetical protein